MARASHPHPNPSPSREKGFSSPLPFRERAASNARRGEGRTIPKQKLLRIPPHLTRAARELRTQQTNAENLLWYLLRNRRFLGIKFRRQFSLPPYVLDFYCPDACLCIELDGGQHNDEPQMEKDKVRDLYLAAKDIQVLRFWNNEVLSETEGVLAAILQVLYERGLLKDEP